MPDPHSPPREDGSPEPDTADRPRVSPQPRGWPLWLRIGLAVVILSFVWSPFLAMLMRLSRINPSLQPTGGVSDFTPPDQPAPAARPGPSSAPAASPPAPAPSP